MDTSKLLLTAIQAALQAGNILRYGYGTTLNVTIKAGDTHNVVTQYDKAAEDAIIKLVRKNFPDHAFLAEESGASTSKIFEAPVLWIIDPLDGTMNFVHNIPLFGVSIAAYAENALQVGVVYIPITNELFVAEKGRGAQLNGSPIRVSTTARLNHTIGATGMPYHIDEQALGHLERFSKIARLGNPIRDLGSAAVDLAYLAAGRFDVYWIPRLQPWDMAAGMLLVEEAGGKVTNYQGEPHPIFPESPMLATNGLVHETMLEYMTEVLTD